MATTLDILSCGVEASAKRRFNLPQYHFLLPFRLSTIQALIDLQKSTASFRTKTKQFCLWSIGLAYILACWTYYFYRMADFISYQSSRPSTSLFYMISVLPEILRATRGPFVMTLFYYRGPSISTLIQHVTYQCRVSQGYSRQLRRIFLLAIPASAFSRLLEILPFKILVVYQLYAKVEQNNSSSQSLNDTNQSSRSERSWCMSTFDITMNAYSYFLSDQVLVLLIFLGLIMRKTLAKLCKNCGEESVDELGESLVEECTGVVNRMAATYEEVRICWSRINIHFMWIFGVAFGLDVMTMMGEVVFLVGCVQGNSLDYIDVSWLRMAMGIGLHCWSVVSSALRVIIVAVPLVLVYEQVSWNSSGLLTKAHTDCSYSSFLYL